MQTYPKLCEAISLFYFVGAKGVASLRFDTKSDHELGSPGTV